MKKNKKERSNIINESLEIYNLLNKKLILLIL